MAISPITVTIEATTNNESPQSKTQEKIVEITQAMQELLLEKNKRYGDAAVNPTKVFSKLDGADSIKIRLDDKLSRVRNSSEVRTNDICDIIGYLTLLLVANEVTKQDILNLID